MELNYSLDGTIAEPGSSNPALNVFAEVCSDISRAIAVRWS
jgi:hypothetical protein